MIGNLRKILTFPSKVVQGLEAIKSRVMVVPTVSAVSPLLSSTYLVVGVRVKYFNRYRFNRFETDVYSQAEKIDLGDHRFSRLIPSLNRNLIDCDEQYDQMLDTAHIMQQHNVVTLTSELSAVHSEVFELVPLKREDKWFHAWYTVELVCTSLTTNQEETFTISSGTYWSDKGWQPQLLLQSVFMTNATRAIERYASELIRLGF